MGVFDSIVGGAAGATLGSIPGVGTVIGAGFGAGVGGGGSLSPTAPNFAKVPRISDIPTNKTVLDLQDQLKAVPAIAPITGYTAKKISGPLPEYDLARQKVNEEANTAGQAGQEALARRFASQGAGLNSGEYIKQAEIQNQNTEANKSSALRDIAMQEAQASRGLQQQEDQREFQSGENAKTFNAQQAFQDKVFRFDSASKLGQLDLGYKSAELQSATEAYNAELNQYMAQHSGGLLGAGGILGTGIGT